MDKSSEEFQRLWCDPLVQQTVHGLNVIIEDHYDQYQHTRGRTAQRLVTEENVEDEGFWDALEKTGSLDPAAFSLALAVRHGGIIASSQKKDELPQEVYDAVIVLEGVEAKMGDMGIMGIFANIPTDVFASRNGLAMKVLLAGLVHGVQGEGFEEMRQHGSKEEKAAFAGMMGFQFSGINECMTDGKLWQVLPEKLMDCYFDVAAKISDMIEVRAQKRVFVETVAELKAAMEADRNPPEPEATSPAIDPDSKYQQMKASSGKRFRL